jgi:hypothetical protein
MISSPPRGKLKKKPTHFGSKCAGFLTLPSGRHEPSGQKISTSNIMNRRKKANTLSNRANRLDYQTGNAPCLLLLVKRQHTFWRA